MWLKKIADFPRVASENNTAFKLVKPYIALKANGNAFEKVAYIWQSRKVWSVVTFYFIFIMSVQLTHTDYEVHFSLFSSVP